MRWLIYAALLFLLYKVVTKASSDARGRRSRMGQAKRKQGLGSSKRTPHEILGVEADASQEDVRRAYQRKMREYHPDRVANAAAELRELAERRSKEINAAYDELRGGQSQEKDSR